MKIICFLLLFSFFADTRCVFDEYECETNYADSTDIIALDSEVKNLQVIYRKKSHAFDAIINLGGNCQIAYQLKEHNLREYALPFDACNVPFDSLYKILSDRFVHFLEPDQFIFHQEPNNKDKYIIQTYYGVVMRHDFRNSPDFMLDYDKVKEKHERRIERLYNLLENSSHVLFIRNRITKEQAVHLDELLERLFPHLNYILLVLGNTPEFTQDWHLTRIKNYFLRQPIPYTWKGDSTSWHELFEWCGLI